MPEHPGPSPAGGDDVFVFTREQVRAVDRAAVEEFGLPSIVLMENAAIHLGDVVIETLEARGADAALIVCGPGSNGGDGLAAARHLHNAGVRVAIVLATAPARATGDAAINLKAVQRMGLPLEVADEGRPAAAIDRAAAGLGRIGVVVDALLGTGLDRPVSGALAAVIERINALRAGGAGVVAADIPSGLDADTGEPLGVAVAADATVTFVGLKKGFLSLAAQPYVGEIHVADIGAPRELAARLGTPLEPPEDADDQPRRGDERRPRRTDGPSRGEG